jgi:hypothetical protein
VTTLLGIRLVLFGICVLAIIGVWWGERTHDLYFFARLLTLFVATLPLVYQPQRVLDVWYREPKTTSVMLIWISLVAVLTLMIFFFPERLVQFLRCLFRVHPRNS